MTGGWTPQLPRLWTSTGVGHRGSPRGHPVSPGPKAAVWQDCAMLDWEAVLAGGLLQPPAPGGRGWAASDLQARQRDSEGIPAVS